MSHKFRLVADWIRHIQGMSISGKFVLMYVVVFAIPIFVYAVYSFNNTNRSIQSSYNQQSVEALDTVYENIRRNIDVSETVIGTAADNAGFMEFINGDMTGDDLQLIQFKRGEYKQIENLKVLNPTVHNIKFYIDNDRIYKLPPLLNGRDDFKDQVLFSRLANLQGREYFMLNNDDVSPMGAPVKVVSLFREVANNRQHEGVIEVNMLQTDFFQELYGNVEETNAMLLVMEAGGTQRFLFNEQSSFHQQRLDRFDSLTEHLKPHTNKEGGSFQFALSGESFVVNYKYMKHLDSYLYQVYSLEGITGQIREVRNDILLAVFVALVVLCLVTYLLSSLLLKKLGAVVTSMHKVQAGDLNVVIPVRRGGDEIDELAGHFNHTLVKVKDLISQLLSEQLAAKEAENKALQSQINSHFVYNVLESIRMMADMEEKEEISEAIYSLGKMMRYSMKWKTQQVSLTEEAAMAGTYVRLMNIVSDVQVELEMHIDSALAACPIPKMSLEPLVENAVVHGIEPTGRNGVVSVAASYSGQFLVVEVTDDGVGMERDRVELINRALEEDNEPIGLTRGNGIGLLNVHKRIRLFCGKPYGIRIESEPGRYTRVVMRLPYQNQIGGW